MSDVAAKAIMWSVIAAAVAAIFCMAEWEAAQSAKSEAAKVEACVKSGGDWGHDWVGPSCKGDPQ